MKYTCVDENGKSAESTTMFGYYKHYKTYKEFIQSEKILEKIKQVKDQKLNVLNKEQTLKMWKEHPVINFLKELFTSIDNPEGTLFQNANWTSIDDIPVFVAHETIHNMFKGNMKYYNVSVWYNVDGNLKNRVLARALIY